MEGQGFRDRTPEFNQAGAQIVGISYDPPEAQKAFREGQNFEFRLIPDTTRQMSEPWGAARPADHQYKDWPRRITYLVDPAGIVAAAWEVKDLRAHPAEVLDLLLSKTAAAD